MPPIMVVYEIKTANGAWRTRKYAPKDKKDYERVLSVVRENPEEYKILSVSCKGGLIHE